MTKVPLCWRKDRVLAHALTVHLAHNLRDDWQLLVEDLPDHDVDHLLHHGQDGGERSMENIRILVTCHLQ